MHASSISNVQLRKAIQRIFFLIRSPVVVSELEEAVHGTDTTADDATSSPPLLENVMMMGQPFSSTIGGSFNSKKNSFQISIPVFVILGYMRSVSPKNISEKLISCNLDVLDTCHFADIWQ
jgi:hypothetical protein